MKASKILELVKIVEQSNINQLEVSRWGQKVKIVKGLTPSNGSGAQIAVQAAPVPAPQPVPQAEQQTTPPASVPVPAPAKKENFIEIRSPMVGTFYRSPAPDAEPYVKAGDPIEPGKVLCIIEAMKLMNEIEAEVSGKIVDILVENAKPVEYNQLLFLVEPIRSA
ncbi:biotin carboxyl carrier protein of acetyl-CoA carboxylase [bacterium BMS3Abin05]|nr:biotin carboxyl carrier protein of acetyl-CoA carboxylase [bacterium BMS3Abin05]HDZ12825.1 acetyl-CoA carboxylase biotin carboxyl carrier protein [Bacteroidota bacterium]